MLINLIPSSCLAVFLLQLALPKTLAPGWKQSKWRMGMNINLSNTPIDILTYGNSSTI